MLALEVSEQRLFFGEGLELRIRACEAGVPTV
jgi:hypothetical protein